MHEYPQDVDLSELTDDGDTLDVSDTLRLRLRIEHDSDTSINDYDFYYGRTEWGNTFGRPQRPKGMDGAAEVIDRDGRYVQWWQPPADMKRTDPGFAGLRRLVLDLIKYGFQCVELEAWEPAYDADGTPLATWVRRGCVSLGGCGSVDRDDVALVVMDLWPELRDQLAHDDVVRQEHRMQRSALNR